MKNQGNRGHNATSGRGAKRSSIRSGRAPIIIVVNNTTINQTFIQHPDSQSVVVPSSAVQLAQAGTQSPWGIDVAHYQEQIDWAKVKATGVEFAFIKATEGGDFIDERYARNWSEAKDKSILRGPYHFFRPRTALQSQIDNFCRVIEQNGIGPGDLPPVLDAEEPKLWKGIGKQKAADLCVGFLEGVKAKLGLRVRPIIYMSSSFSADVLGEDPRLAEYLLWVADYTPPVPGQPRIPKPWASWDWYQFSEHGTLDGIPGHEVDINRFNGDRSRLNSLLIR